MRQSINSFSGALTLAALFALPLGLSACGREANEAKTVEALDEKLIGKGSDPEMNVAVQDRILVDPEMADSANTNVVKTAPEPVGSPIPPDNGYEAAGASRSARTAVASAEDIDSARIMRAPKPTIVAAEDCQGCGAHRGKTLGALAEDQGVARGKGTCDAKLTYGAAWSTRMPYEFPVYPRGRLQEAGGVENGICDIRVVSFTTSAAMKDVVDYYYTRASRSGYSAEYQIRAGEHTLGGVRDKDSGAYVITFNPHAGGGTSVDIVANNGR